MCLTHTPQLGYVWILCQNGTGMMHIHQTCSFGLSSILANLHMHMKGSPVMRIQSVSRDFRGPSVTRVSSQQSPRDLQVCVSML